MLTQVHTQYPIGNESKGLVTHSGHLDNVLHVYTSGFTARIHSAQSQPSRRNDSAHRVRSHTIEL